MLWLRHADIFFTNKIHAKAWLQFHSCDLREGKTTCKPSPIIETKVLSVHADRPWAFWEFVTCVAAVGWFLDPARTDKWTAVWCQRCDKHHFGSFKPNIQRTLCAINSHRVVISQTVAMVVICFNAAGWKASDAASSTLNQFNTKAHKQLWWIIGHFCNPDLLLAMIYEHGNVISTLSAKQPLKVEFSTCLIED